MCQSLTLIEPEAYVARMQNMFQMFQGQCLAFPDYHKAAISPITFGLGGKWGIMWRRV